MADIGGAFNLDFAEQAAFFRGKLNLPTAAWDDIWKAEHDHGFVVAGAIKADLLNDLRQAVDRGITDGTGLDQFRAQFPDIVARHGWHGWTGEGSAEGEAWRTRVIFETNLRTSYAAGRYAQLTDPELLASRPYWQYIHSDNAAHPREQHKAWGDAKLTLLHDHPFWQTAFPPNGFGCGCTVKAVRKPADGAQTKLPAGWDEIDPKTGEPPGIGKGWGYAPGASRADELRELAAQKASQMPEPLKSDALKALAAPLPAVPATQTAQPLTLDDYIAAGRKITDQIKPAVAHADFMELYKQHVNIGMACHTANGGQGAQLVKNASKLFPAEWVQAADAAGPLYVRKAKGRGYATTILKPRKYRLDNFGTVTADIGDGFIVVRDLDNAVHEFAHRIQASLPALNDLFQAIHDRRTSGDALKSLRKLTGTNYRLDELTREDHYINGYWGKDYDGKALEVLTMSMETVLTGRHFNKLYTKDREMLDFVVGILFNWRP
ncbi:MAG: phage head morphogenesis protein [Azoarcus sp.]|jgi:hypothetical protein|nr:phage head morphogenesis protein [Azoarcus sp.]